jgi:putative membrane protein insertion efficiency factor
VSATFHPGRRAAHYAIRFYQVTLSSVMGRQCRYLPTCSSFTDDAIQAHGVWAGGWMGLARICRCNPWGGSGFDPAPERPPANAHPLAPWRYGRWREPPRCESVDQP